MMGRRRPATCSFVSWPADHQDVLTPAGHSRLHNSLQEVCRGSTELGSSQWLQGPFARFSLTSWSCQHDCRNPEEPVGSLRVYTTAQEPLGWGGRVEVLVGGVNIASWKSSSFCVLGTGTNCAGHLFDFKWAWEALWYFSIYINWFVQARNIKKKGGQVESSRRWSLLSFFLH